MEVRLVEFEQITIEDMGCEINVHKEKEVDIKKEQYDFRNVIDSDNEFEMINNENSLAILGDSLAVLKKMKDKSVNLIFADAPYNIGKNFGNNQDKWENVKAYIEWCKEWLDECMIILKDD